MSFVVSYKVNTTCDVQNMISYMALHFVLIFAYFDITDGTYGI